MHEEEKFELIGAGVQVTAKSLSQLVYQYLRSTGKTDAQIRSNPWFSLVGGQFPPTDDYVTCLGIPGALAAGAFISPRGSRRRMMLKELAEGSALTGLPVFLDHLIMFQGPKLLPPVGQASPLNIDMSFPSTNVIHQATIQPAPTNQESALPWQRNLEW